MIDREIEKPSSHNKRGEALRRRDGRATGRVTDNGANDVHFKESGVLRAKERKPESDSEEFALQGTQAFQALPTKRTT